MIHEHFAVIANIELQKILNVFSPIKIFTMRKANRNTVSPFFDEKVFRNLILSPVFIPNQHSKKLGWKAKIDGHLM